MKKYLTYSQALEGLALLEEAPVDAWPDPEMRGIAIMNKNEALPPIQNRWQTILQRTVQEHIVEQIDTDTLPENGEGEIPEHLTDLTGIELQLGARLDDPAEVNLRLQEKQQELVEVRLAVYGDGPEDYEEARQKCEQAAEAITEVRREEAGEEEDVQEVTADDLSFLWPIER